MLAEARILVPVNHLLEHENYILYDRVLFLVKITISLLYKIYFGDFIVEIRSCGVFFRHHFFERETCFDLHLDFDGELPESDDESDFQIGVANVGGVLLVVVQDEKSVFCKELGLRKHRRLFTIIFSLQLLYHLFNLPHFYDFPISDSANRRFLFEIYSLKFFLIFLQLSIYVFLRHR